MWWNVLCDADRNGANRRAQIIENVICQLRRIRGRQTYITLHLYSERVWKNQFRALDLMRKCEKKFGDQRGLGFLLLLLVEVSCAHSTWFPTEDASSLVINRLLIAIFVTSNRTKLKESNKQSPGELSNCTHKTTAQWMRWKTSRNGIYGSTFSYNDNVDDHQRCLWSASAGRLAFFSFVSIACSFALFCHNRWQYNKRAAESWMGQIKGNKTKHDFPTSFSFTIFRVKSISKITKCFSFIIILCVHLIFHLDGTRLQRHDDVASS